MSRPWRLSSPWTGRMSKKIEEWSTASGVGSVSHDENSRRQRASGWRQRGLVAMTSPRHRG